MRIGIRFSYICSLLRLRHAKQGQAGNPKPKPFPFHCRQCFGTLRTAFFSVAPYPWGGPAASPCQRSAPTTLPTSRFERSRPARAASPRKLSTFVKARPRPHSPPATVRCAQSLFLGSFVPRTLGTQSLPASPCRLRLRGRFLFAERDFPSTETFFCEHSAAGRNN